ncbi:hypothetical protein BH11ACT8_BH11ACT8_12200 [soil metagenome]
MSGVDRFSAEIREEARQSTWWWSMAENPTCRPWCSTAHDRDEFRVHGELTCSRSFGSSVEVVQMQAGDEEVPFLVDLEQVSLAIFHDGDDLGIEAAEVLARELVAAAGFARGVAL